MCNIILSQVRVTICCRAKAIRSKYFECVSVFLPLLPGCQAAACLRHVICACGLSDSVILSYITSKTKIVSGEKLLNRKCVTSFSKPSV